MSVVHVSILHCIYVLRIPMVFFLGWRTRCPNEVMFYSQRNPCLQDTYPKNLLSFYMQRSFAQVTVSCRKDRCKHFCLIADETDEEDEARPSRRRRIAQQAAEGEEQDEEEVRALLAFHPLPPEFHPFSPPTLHPHYPPPWHTPNKSNEGMRIIF